MKDAAKFFFQNPNTGTPMIVTLGQTGQVCLFVDDGWETSEQDAKDLLRWESLAGACGRGSKALGAMCSQLRHEGADLS